MPPLNCHRMGHPVPTETLLACSCSVLSHANSFAPHANRLDQRPAQHTSAVCVQPSQTRWPHGPVKQAPGSRHTGQGVAPVSCSGGADDEETKSPMPWRLAALRTAADLLPRCTSPLLRRAPAGWPSSASSSLAHWATFLCCSTSAAAALPWLFNALGSPPAAITAAAAATAPSTLPLNMAAQCSAVLPSLSFKCTSACAATSAHTAAAATAALLCLATTCCGAWEGKALSHEASGTRQGWSAEAGCASIAGAQQRNADTSQHRRDPMLKLTSVVAPSFVLALTSVPDVTRACTAATAASALVCMPTQCCVGKVGKEGHAGQWALLGSWQQQEQTASSSS